jgi:antirestriction protein
MRWNHETFNGVLRESVGLTNRRANYATEDDFSDRYAGEADTELDWVEQHLEDCGTLESIPENLRYYFDSERYLRDMKMGAKCLLFATLAPCTPFGPN